MLCLRILDLTTSKLRTFEDKGRRRKDRAMRASSATSTRQANALQHGPVPSGCNHVLHVKRERPLPDVYSGFADKLPMGQL